MNIYGPVIEEFDQGCLMDQRRCEIIKDVYPLLTDVRQGKESSTDARERYYHAVGELLNSFESIRLALYLPFATLMDAPADFKKIYMRAWRHLLGVRDMREKFNEGDTFEPEARPAEGLEWVAKAAHLTPWLLKSGYLTYGTIMYILQSQEDRSEKQQAILLQSFRDVERCLVDWGLVGFCEFSRIHAATQAAPERREVEPTYVSAGREAWLAEKSAAPVPLLTPDAPLEGPFSPNLAAFRAEIETVAKQLEPHEIVLVSGSKLKGYGTVKSDLDVHRLSGLKQSVEFGPGSPHAAHLYLNSLWVGGSAVQDLPAIAQSYAKQYENGNWENRRLSLECLEKDLLQYRLLHKGFARMTGEQPLMASYPEMEGGSMFYNDNYRIIATLLYIKYVYLPKSYN